METDGAIGPTLRRPRGRRAYRFLPDLLHHLRHALRRPEVSPLWRRRPRALSPVSRPTDDEYTTLLARAEAGADLLPCLPDLDVERCEFCGRPDWERAGNCLARTRQARPRLARALLAVQEVQERNGRARGDYALTRALAEIVDAFDELGVRPTDADVATMRERRAHYRAR